MNSTDTPYAGSSGWSGSATSKERADREDASGVTGWRSRQVFDLIAAAGRSGMTDKEVQAALNVGHGASSGTLTRLHRAAHIARLTRRRNGNEVYVLPEHVNGRETQPYRPNSGKTAAARAKALEEAITEAQDLIDRGSPTKAWHVLEQARLAR